MRDTLRVSRAKGVVLEIVDDVIAYPVITISMAANLHHVTYPPAKNAILRLVELGFLGEVTGQTYGKVYTCRRVMEIVDEPVRGLSATRNGRRWTSFQRAARIVEVGRCQPDMTRPGLPDPATAVGETGAVYGNGPAERIALPDRDDTGEVNQPGRIPAAG